jgi:hypothetical protein
MPSLVSPLLERFSHTHTIIGGCVLKQTGNNTAQTRKQNIEIICLLCPNPVPSSMKTKTLDWVEILNKILCFSVGLVQ